MSARSHLGAGAAAFLAALALCAPALAAGGADNRDVNGDGLADLAMPDEVDAFVSDGATLLFGRRDRATPARREAPGSAGFRIREQAHRLFGEAAIAGDVNGDGRADILATSADDLEHVYVVFGKPDTATVTLNQGGTEFPSPTAGFFSGATGVFLNVSAENAAPAGDVNADGLADIVTQGNGRRTLARTWFGARSHPLTQGFRIVVGGRVRERVVPHPVAVGDINGDGLGDLALDVADPGVRPRGVEYQEMVAVVWGRRDGAAVTVTAGRSRRSARVVSGGRPAGRILLSRHPRCVCRVQSMAPAGDLNGDGLADLAIRWDNPFRSDVPFDVVFGSRSSRATALPGARSVQVKHVDFIDGFGSGGGDLTGDGRDDLLLPVLSANPGLRVLSGAHAHGVVDARRLGRPLVRGITESVAPAGDVDGDGHPDLLIGYNLTSYAIAYGASPQPHVDLSRPSADLELLPCVEPPHAKHDHCDN